MARTNVKTLVRKKTTVLSRKDELLNSETALLCNALGHPMRVQILRLLLDRNCIFGDLARQLPLAQSTISQHLSILKEAGLVSRESLGKHTCYCIECNQVERLKGLIGELCC